MDDIRQVVTDRMIAALQRGTVPWSKPWRAEAGRPRSMTTARPYRGVNVFLLALTAAERGYDSPWWGTYRQITALGGQVRRGERSTLVVFWKPAEITARDPATGDPVVKTIPVLRHYRAFNSAQAGGLPARFLPEACPATVIPGPQQVLDGYLRAGGPRLRHVAGDLADYQPGTDLVRLPPRAQFRSPQHYYASAFHETGHSTGHPARLNRPGIAGFDHFGSGRYAREELAAEMTSAMLCASTGIDDPGIFGNSASYVSGWLAALRRDNSLVITAAGQAQRACELISDPERHPVRDRGADQRAVALTAATPRAQPPRPATDRQAEAG